MTGVDGINFVTVRIDSNKCNYCMECIRCCPTQALRFDRDVVVFLHNAYECSYCEVCMDVCEPQAITIMEQMIL